MMIESIKKVFAEKFQDEPLIIRSPGRINIIGEHTDYNNGFVLPGAIDKAVYIAISKRDDDVINLYAADYKEDFSSRLADLQPSNKHWPNYINGVIHQLLQHGFDLTGFNIVVDGDVPLGAGLSSSAAVECATAFALNELFDLHISKMEMVKTAQAAEHAFAGVKVGIMDMFASMFGKKEHVIKLDCRSLEYEYVPIKLDAIKIVLFNTNVKHSLASTEYNVRREQCEQGVEWLKEKYAEVTSLRDATTAMLDEMILPRDKIIYKRCRFIIEENERLLLACEDLRHNNIEALGKKIFASHNGLSKDYEVSCKELDFLVEKVRGNINVLGARMMGGGFGGCTINLIKENAVNDITETLIQQYEEAMHLPLTPYVMSVEDGTSLA